jgi:hypothetical protein
MDINEQVEMLRKVVIVRLTEKYFGTWGRPWDKLDDICKKKEISMDDLVNEHLKNLKNGESPSKHEVDTVKRNKNLGVHVLRNYLVKNIQIDEVIKLFINDKEDREWFISDFPSDEYMILTQFI